MEKEIKTLIIILAIIGLGWLGYYLVSRTCPIIEADTINKASENNIQTTFNNIFLGIQEGGLVGIPIKTDEGVKTFYITNYKAE